MLITEIWHNRQVVVPSSSANGWVWGRASDNPINETVMENQAKYYSMSRWAKSAMPDTRNNITSVLGVQGFSRAVIPRVKLARAKATPNYKIRRDNRVIY